MARLTLILALVGSWATAAHASPLVVQLVDPVWLVMPSMQVELIRVTDCATRTQVSRTEQRTRSDGTARFVIAEPGSSLITAGDTGWLPQTRCVRLFAEPGAQYVQIHVPIGPRLSTTLIQRGIAEGAPPRRPTLGDLTGAYIDSTGGIHVVGLLEDGRGLELRLPNAESRYFTATEGRWRYEGETGILEFQTDGERVVGFTWSRRTIEAMKEP